jgi:hypothetical protein
VRCVARIIPCAAKLSSCNMHAVLQRSPGAKSWHGHVNKMLPALRAVVPQLLTGRPKVALNFKRTGKPVSLPLDYYGILQLSNTSVTTALSPGDIEKNDTEADFCLRARQRCDQMSATPTQVCHCAREALWAGVHVCTLWAGGGEMNFPSMWSLDGF